MMEDHVYEYGGDRDFPLRYRLELAVHAFFCSRCAGKLARLEYAREIMRNAFLPSLEDASGAEEGSAAFRLEDRIMERVALEDIEPEEENIAAAPAFRSWVIGGIITLVSLGSVILGIDFACMASSLGSSFLIPLGLTIGMVITVYGAIFIGSHIKELAERFRLH
jgi:hypothetical protein